MTKHFTPSNGVKQPSSYTSQHYPQRPLSSFGYLLVTFNTIAMNDTKAFNGCARAQARSTSYEWQLQPPLVADRLSFGGLAPPKPDCSSSNFGVSEIPHAIPLPTPEVVASVLILQKQLENASATLQNLLRMLLQTRKIIPSEMASQVAQVRYLLQALQTVWISRRCPVDGSDRRDRPSLGLPGRGPGPTRPELQAKPFFRYVHSTSHAGPQATVVLDWSVVNIPAHFAQYPAQGPGEATL